MAQAAYCSACGRNVYVTAEGRCQNGHDASCLSGHYLAPDPSPAPQQPVVQGAAVPAQAQPAYAAPQTPYAAPQPGFPMAGAALVTPESTNITGPRAGAFVIDYAIVTVLNMVLGAVVGFVGALVLVGTGTDRDLIGLIVQVIAFVLGIAFITSYFAIPEYLWGATLGKRLLRVRVVGLDGGGITLGQAYGRNLALLIDLLFFGLVGLLTMNASPLHQRLGDKWANTAVIRAA